MAGLGEACAFIDGDAFLDALQNVVVARFITDQEQAQAAIFEET